MDQLTQLLAGLGPWGVVAALAIPLVMNYLRTGQVIPPKQPVAPAGPQPAPAQPDAPLIPVLPNRPLLNAGLQLLQLLAQKKMAQAQAPVTPYAALPYDPHQALEDEVLKRVAAELTPSK